MKVDWDNANEFLIILSDSERTALKKLSQLTNMSEVDLVRIFVECGFACSSMYIANQRFPNHDKS